MTKLIEIINRYCRRSDGQLKPHMIKPEPWKKLGLEHQYRELIECCGHASPTFAQVVYHLSNGLGPIAMCPVCASQLKWSKTKSSYPEFCSRKCASNSQKRKDAWRKTNFDRYGDGNYGQSTGKGLERRRSSCLKKYGTDSFSKTDKFKSLMSENNPMHREDVKAKVTQTMQNRYGEPWAMQNAEMLSKRKSTYEKKYGKEHASQHPDVKQKLKDTHMSRYGVENIKHLLLSSQAQEMLFDVTHFTDEFNSLGPQGLAEKYSTDVTTVYNYAHRYNLMPEKSKSSLEIIMHGVLKQAGITDYITNDRTVLQGKELDIYVPQKKLAIEVNGIYWHSEASPTNRSKNYHFDKWKACRDLGITLLQYTDNDIIHRKHIIESKLKYHNNTKRPITGARKCQIKQVTFLEEKTLLEKHHIQGSLIAKTKSLGAYHNDNLVAVINVAKRKNYLEVTRYCCDTATSYPGLFSRLLKAIVTELGYHGDIVSFSNNDHSNGRVYEAAGFYLDKVLAPAYWYTRDFKSLENRQRYMKNKIKKKFDLSDEYVYNNTEQQIMAVLGYYRYYDSGKIKWKTHTNNFIKRKKI